MTEANDKKDHSDVEHFDRTLSLADAVSFVRALGLSSFSVELDSRYLDAEPGAHRYNVVPRSGHSVDGYLASHPTIEPRFVDDL